MLRATVLALLLAGSACYAMVVPPLRGEVNDEVGLLSPTEKQTLTASIRQLNEQHQVQFALLIVSSLQGMELEPFSMAVAESWKLGEKKTDRGLIFLIAPNDRKMRIEVGQGLEGELPDVFCKRLLRDEVGPYFKQGKHAAGILQGISRISAQLSGIGSPAPATTRRVALGNLLSPLLLLLMLIFFVVIPILGRAGRGGGRHYRGSTSGRDDWLGGGGGFSGGGGFFGGGGGGGFAGGGGGFSGGGSSSSW